MNSAIFEQMNKLGMSSYETMKQLYAINTNFAGQMLEQQFALAALATDYTTREMKLASTAKGYKEIMAAQTDIAAEISSKLQGIARNTLDICNESKDEIGTWFEKAVKEAEKGIKEAAKVVPITKAA